MLSSKLAALLYHVSCEPLRIFWNDDTTCPTKVSRVLSTTSWKARNPARSKQHAWHSCRAGCNVISENPQGLATHMVQYQASLYSCMPYRFGLLLHSSYSSPSLQEESNPDKNAALENVLGSIWWLTNLSWTLTQKWYLLKCPLGLSQSVPFSRYPRHSSNTRSCCCGTFSYFLNSFLSLIDYFRRSTRWIVEDEWGSTSAELTLAWFRTTQ